MILISSHLDRVVQDYDLSYKKGVFTGLLDNFIGVLVSYLVLFDDVNIASLEKEGIISFWHNKGEEWGRMVNHPVLKKNDIVICVDVASGDYYNNLDFAIDNVKVDNEDKFIDIINDLRTEGFRFKVNNYTEKLNQYIWEDESWGWIKKGIQAMTFIIPINAEDDGWHRFAMDNTIEYERVKIAVQGFKRLVNHLI